MSSSKELLIESSIFELEKVRLFNLLGQEVLTSPLKGNREQIDIQTLNPGIYIAQIVSDGRLASFKFSKY